MQRSVISSWTHQGGNQLYILMERDLAHFLAVSKMTFAMVHGRIQTVSETARNRRKLWKFTRTWCRWKCVQQICWKRFEKWRNLDKSLSLRFCLYSRSKTSEFHSYVLRGRTDKPSDRGRHKSKSRHELNSPGDSLTPPVPINYNRVTSVRIVRDRTTKW